MSYCLYELYMHQDIQDKARSEINTILKKYDGNFTYEAMKETTYINQIINGKFELAACVRQYHFYLLILLESYSFRVLENIPLEQTSLELCQEIMPFPIPTMYCRKTL